MRKFTIKLAALAWMLVVYSIFVGMFLVAYSNPEKAVRVVINSYGEAHVELFVLLGGAIVVMAGTVLTAMDMVRRLHEDVQLKVAEELAERGLEI